MPPALIVAGVGLGIAAVGTVSTISAQKKMQKAQQKQFAYQRSMDQMKSARERTQAIRAARMSIGTAEQNAVNQGAQDTSASLGGIGSIQSQLSGGLSFLDASNYLSDQAGIQAAKASKASIDAQIGGAITSLGMTVFSNSSGISKTVFGK